MLINDSADSPELLGEINFNVLLKNFIFIKFCQCGYNCGLFDPCRCLRKKLPFNLNIRPFLNCLKVTLYNK